MVSIIMPVYNASRFLKETIDSILNQTYTDFEFLIFNDGSTDESFSIIQHYKDPRIRLINSAENKGYLYWLNVGIQEAKGEYIARMDADDIAMPKRLEKQVAFLDQNPSIAILGTRILIFNESGSKEFDSLLSEEEIRWGLIFKNRLIHPSVMMRRNALISNNILYKDEFYGSEDYRYWTEAIMQGLRVTNLSGEVLLKYRDHGNNFTKKNRERQLLNSRAIALDYLRFILPAIDEKIAASMIGKLYETNPDQIKSLFFDFQKYCNPKELSFVLVFLSERIMDLFFELPSPTLKDLIRFRKILSNLPNRRYPDNKKMILFKHYLKLKLTRKT